MSSFLKLSKNLINTNYIRNINILKTKYEIKLISYEVDGEILFGSGTIYTACSTIDICEKENPEDYNTVKKWILVQENN